MTLTIDLTPEQEAQLSDAAREIGLNVNELARKLLAERLPSVAGNHAVDADASPLGVDRDHFYFTATPEEFNRALDEIAEMNRGLPILPSEAFDRENLYEESL